MLALSPDVVIVATGGLPQNPPLEAGGELVTSSWDIIAGAVKPADNVLLYDDNGGHQGMTAAELIAHAGSKLELLSPERSAPEMGGMNHVPYMSAFHEKGLRSPSTPASMPCGAREISWSQRCRRIHATIKP